MSRLAGPLDLSQIFSNGTFSLPMRKRLTRTLTQLGRDPQASLPAALGDASYKGLMRALKNPGVGTSALFDAVYQATLDRIGPEQDVLSIEDTTDLTFGGARGRKTLPRLEGKATGFRAHIALAVSADATHSIFGVLDLRQIVRGDETKAEQSDMERYLDPNKESLRWPQTVEATEARVDGRASLIHVRDREGDDYSQLATMVSKKQRFVQRMRQSRRLAEAPADAPTARKIDEAFDGVAGICEREVALSARGQSKFDARPISARTTHPARRQRKARLRFTARRLRIKRPQNAPEHLPAALDLNVVHVVEMDPPAGADPVEWYVFTKEPIETEDDVLRVVDIYRARWLIEEFNKALQTGCQYEKLQCETPERLWSMLAFYSPIATNLLALRTLAHHHDAERSASDVLSEEEIAVLRAAPRAKADPKLTVKTALLLIAALGGHFRHNGEPGWLVLLRGMVRLREQAEGWRIAQQVLAHATVPS